MAQDLTIEAEARALCAALDAAEAAGDDAEALEAAVRALGEAARAALNEGAA